MKTASRGTPLLVRIGNICAVVGVTAVALGVVFGFGLLVLGATEWALKLLLLAPIGMILVFVGLSGALLAGAPVQARGPEDS